MAADTTQSSRPHHHPKELSQEMIWTIIEKRKKVKRSAEVVHRGLLNDGIVVSLFSVKRTLDLWELLNKRSPLKPAPAAREAATPKPKPTQTLHTAYQPLLSRLIAYSRV